MEKGIKQGKGIYNFAKKKKQAKYDGMYAENHRTGYGIMTYPDKSTYEGETQINS